MPGDDVALAAEDRVAYLQGADVADRGIDELYLVMEVGRVDTVVVEELLNAVHKPGAERLRIAQDVGLLEMLLGAICGDCLTEAGPGAVVIPDT